MSIKEGRVVSQTKNSGLETNVCSAEFRGKNNILEDKFYKPYFHSQLNLDSFYPFEQFAWANSGE